MTPARGLLVGVDGPEVLVSARVAHRIAPRLVGWLREQVDGGATADPEVVEVVRALQLAGHGYAAGRVTSVHGSSGLPSPAELPSSRHGWITAQQAADRLGCSPRNVADLRARGRLVAEQVDGRWRYCPSSVAEHADRRAA